MKNAFTPQLLCFEFKNQVSLKPLTASVRLWRLAHEKNKKSPRCSRHCGAYPCQPLLLCMTKTVPMMVMMPSIIKRTIQTKS